MRAYLPLHVPLPPATPPETVPVDQPNWRAQHQSIPTGDPLRLGARQHPGVDAVGGVAEDARLGPGVLRDGWVRGEPGVERSRLRARLEAGNRVEPTSRPVPF